MVWDQDETKKYMREWYVKNKEKIKDKRTKWRKENKDKQRLYSWKARGVKGDLKELHDRWLKTTNCEVCGDCFEDTPKCIKNDYITCKSCIRLNNMLTRDENIREVHT